MSDKPISRRVRFEILRRDDNTCQYCGAKAPEVPLTVDHVIPRSLGGSDDPSNLVCACRDCNAGKASTSPDEHTVAAVNTKALEWAEALGAAAEARRAEFAALDREVWFVNEYWQNLKFSNGEPAPRPDGYVSSLERFVAAGLDRDDLVRLIDVAIYSKASYSEKWRYFCGCAWKEITTRQQMAVEVLSASGSDDPAADDSGSYDAGWQDGYRQGCTEALLDSHEAQTLYDAGFRAGARRWSGYIAERDEVDPDASDWRD